MDTHMTNTFYFPHVNTFCCIHPVSEHLDVIFRDDATSASKFPYKPFLIHLLQGGHHIPNLRAHRQKQIWNPFTCTSVMTSVKYCGWHYRPRICITWCWKSSVNKSISAYIFKILFLNEFYFLWNWITNAVLLGILCTTFKLPKTCYTLCSVHI